MKRRRSITVLRWCLLIGFNCVICFVAAEVAVRMVFSNRYHFPDKMIVESPTLRIALAPSVWEKHYNVHSHSPGQPHVFWSVYTNRFGWREPEFPTEKKPPDTYRLMMLGDSVTFGFGVPYEYSIGAFLQQSLNLSRNEDWQVLNRSVPGWFGFHQMTYLEHGAAAWSPDLLVVNVVMNDFKPMSDDAMLESAIDPYHASGNSPWYRHFHVFNLMLDLTNDLWKDRFHEFLAKPPLLSWEPRGRVPPEHYGLYEKDNWWFIRGEYDTPVKRELYDQAKRESYPRYPRMKAMADAMGVPLLVVVYPTSSQVSTRYWNRQKQGDAILEARSIVEFCSYLDREGIAYLNLLERFRNERERALFIDECHLSRSGNSVAAEEIISWMEGNLAGLQLYGDAFFE